MLLCFNRLFSDWRSKYDEVPDVHRAAFDGDMTSLKKIIASGNGRAVADQPITDGPKLLKEKDSKFDVTFCRRNYVGFYLNTTPLIMASQQGHIDVVRYLVEKEQVAVDGTDSLGVTSIAVASAYGRTEVAKYLLSRRSDINVQDKRLGLTPLMFAVINNQTEMAKLLIKMRANVNFPDQHGRRAVHFAAWNGNSELVELLIKTSGSKQAIHVQDAEGNTPLHVVVSDINIDNHEDFNSARETSAAYDIISRIAKYPELAVDISRQRHLPGRQIGDDINCLAKLIKLGASVNMRNNAGRTPFHVLCSNLVPIVHTQKRLFIEDFSNCQTQMVMFYILLKSGTQTNVFDYIGTTPLTLSLENRNWLAVKLLDGKPEVPPRTEVTAVTSRTLKDAVRLYGWSRFTDADAFVADVNEMAAAVLLTSGSRRKGSAKLAERVLNML